MRRRIPELDGFRVALVFLVSWFHIWQQSWLTPFIGRTSLDFLVRAGYMFVDGTILLSGFLLFLPWAQARHDGGPLPETRGFYEKRIARIVPSYVFFTLLMLFGVALPENRYGGDTARIWGDVAAHLTFTQTFFFPTYLNTHLGGQSWTIAVEMQMYLLFPWIARAAVRRPGTVLLGMTSASLFFRGWCVWTMREYGMVVNQLASFLDVYALGMAAALAWPLLRERYDALEKKPRLAVQAAATVLAALAVWGMVVLLHRQAASPDYPALQSGQMMRRPMWAVLLCAVMVALPFSLAPVRFLFGNPLMRGLSAVSMNYYLIHQSLAVQLKTWGFPAPTPGLYNPDRLPPNQLGDSAWQYSYTWASFGFSLLAAIVVTLLIEKPAALGLKKLFARLRRGKQAPPGNAREGTDEAVVS